MAYKVQTPDGAWHSTDDLTGFELEAIQQATNTPWSTLNPYRDIASYRAVVAAFAIRGGMDNADIVDWFNTRTTKQLDEGLAIATDDDLDLPGTFEDGLPKAEDVPSTGTSVDSLEHLSDGPQTS